VIQSPLVEGREAEERHRVSVSQSPANKNVNMEAEEATSLEAVARQPINTQKTEKILRAF
jgi:hypothetical protein